MRRLIAFVTAASLAVVLAAQAAAQSGPPQQTQEPIFGVASDQSTYVLFINITAEDFCAWIEEGDFEAPPPVVAPVTVQQKVTGQGAVVETFRATVYAELWAVEGGDPEAICEGAGELVGTGTVFTVSTDNDVFVSGTRTNAFGATLHGTIHGDEGTFGVSGAFRALITMDEFRVLREQLSVRPAR
jgi:hypothetical protein